MAGGMAGWRHSWLCYVHTGHASRNRCQLQALRFRSGSMGSHRGPCRLRPFSALVSARTRCTHPAARAKGDVARAARLHPSPGYTTIDRWWRRAKGRRPRRVGRISLDQRSFFLVSLRASCTPSAEALSSFGPEGRLRGAACLIRAVGFANRRQRRGLERWKPGGALALATPIGWGEPGRGGGLSQGLLG